MSRELRTRAAPGAWWDAGASGGTPAPKKQKTSNSKNPPGSSFAYAGRRVRKKFGGKYFYGGELYKLNAGDA
jgi:hypothetical protein